MRAARRRVRYETWYFLHLYTYLAIALAFSHQLADGAAFVGNLAARFWWSAMYLTVLVLVLWYRFAVPLLAYRKHRFEVVGVKAEGPGVISVYIGGRRFEELRRRARAVLPLAVPDRGRCGGPRTRSRCPPRQEPTYCGSPSRTWATTARRSRSCSPAPGSSPRARTGRSPPPIPVAAQVLLAGGVGITPLRAIFATLPGHVTLIYRASSERDLVFREELDAIAAARGATVHYLVGSRAQIGGDPLSPRVLRSLVPAWTSRKPTSAAGRHDLGRRPRAARRRGTAAAHPLRVVRVLREDPRHAPGDPGRRRHHRRSRGPAVVQVARAVRPGGCHDRRFGRYLVLVFAVVLGRRADRSRPGASRRGR